MLHVLYAHFGIIFKEIFFAAVPLHHVLFLIFELNLVVTVEKYAVLRRVTRNNYGKRGKTYRFFQNSFI
jgi:hypothetical protein